ncbi:hypothetical protein I3F58_25515 [Streptomyces sp. MUM 203J]|uniref:hypothetical protein n=1 Tax=Streptomyces sp. MUM 203J TaxID=2791990 RepID=UPI001F04BACA|nr:hypothetical protein [Streptomyces sp. MUM 203J]MCH0542855.1 hypothetical protein [Streptomyces sp. MUM 203J]
MRSTARKTHRGRARRGARALTAAALLVGAALAGLAAPAGAAAASPAPTASAGEDGEPPAPTEAGTSFRTATAVRPGQRATAQASTGDYLYWQFPADAGDRATVRATVTLPDTSARKTGTTWRIDVYDGLRRRQACRFGSDAKSLPAGGAGSVELACHLRTVRGSAEPWSDDPLPGAYYVRLTAVDLGAADIGLGFGAALDVSLDEAGAAAHVDGKLAAPLVQGSASTVEPEDGWASGWWSTRWLWTAGGAALAALAGIWGYGLTRGRGRPAGAPPAR